MPTRVQLPNGQIAEFPDGMTQEQIQAALASINPVEISAKSGNTEQAWDAVAGRPAGGLTQLGGNALDAISPDRAAPVVADMSDEDYQNVGSPTAWGANLKNAINRGAEVGVGLMGAAGRGIKAATDNTMFAPGGAAVGEALQRPGEAVREGRVVTEQERQLRGQPSLAAMDRGEGVSGMAAMGSNLNRSGAAVDEFGQQIVDTHTTEESRANAAGLAKAWDDGILTGLGFMAKNPLATTDVVLPSLIEYAAPGGAAGRAVRASKLEAAALSADRAAQRVLAEGGDELAQAAARTDAMLAGTKAAAQAAGTTSASVQAGQSAAVQGTQAGQQIMALSPEQLATIPGFNDIAQQVGVERAQEILAREAGDATSLASAVINAATYVGAQRLGLNPLETRIAGGPSVAGAAAAKTGMAGRAARAGVHGAQEAAGEFVQGAGEQVGQNLGMSAVDSRVGVSDNVLSSGVMEAAVGFGAGAASGATTGAQAPTKPADPIIPGSEVDNAAPKPDAATPEGRGAAMADGIMREAGVGTAPLIKPVPAVAPTPGANEDADSELDALAAPYAPEAILAGQDNAAAAAAALGDATAQRAPLKTAAEEVAAGLVLEPAPTAQGETVSTPASTAPEGADSAPALDYQPPRADWEAPSFGHASWPITVPDTDPIWEAIPQGQTAGITTPERQQLRERMVKEHFRGVRPVAEAEGRKPVAYVMGGGGASGKGTLLSQLQQQGRVPTTNVVHLDPDTAKSQIPEYRALVDRGDSRAAHVTHEESSQITDKARQIATAGKYDMVIDRTLGDPVKARAELEALRRAGYEVRLFGMTLDPNTAIDRGYSRAQKRGRYVPTEAMLKAHKGFAEGFESYLPYTDQAELYDNSGEVPELLANTADGVLQINTDEAYNKFRQRSGINEKAGTHRELAESAGQKSDPELQRQRTQAVHDRAVERSAEGEERAAGPAGGAEALSPVAAAAAEAATNPDNDLPEPTDAQKEAGNYAKGHLSIGGLDIAIENPAGSKRRPEWPTLKYAYGYFNGTEGKDGDHVDVFLSDEATNTSKPVFVIDQNNKGGDFDEHKVMLGFDTEAAAREAYLSNYTKGWAGLGAATEMTFDQFKGWVQDPAATQVRATDNPNDELTTEISRILETAGVEGGAKLVTVVDSAEDLSKRLRSTADGETDGLYDPKTKRIYLIRGALPTDQRAAIDRAAWVIWHELAGHFGIRRAFPTAEALGKVLAEAGTNPTVKALADAIAAERGNTAPELATEEALAELAAAQRTGNYTALTERYGVEIPADKTGIAAAIAKVVKVLKQLIAFHFGGKLPYSDVQVRELLEGAFAHVRAAAREAAANAATQQETPDTRVGESLQSRRESGITDNDPRGTSAPVQSRRTPADAVIDRNKKLAGLNQQGYPVSSFPQTGSSWALAQRTKKQAALLEIRRVLQDRMIGVREGIRAIEAAIGGPLNDLANVYRAENLMHGKAADGVRKVRDLLVDPLKAAVKASGLPVSEIEQFLWAQHAIERNKRIAKINPGMPDGGAGISTADAQAIVSAAMASPKAAELQAISQLVQDLRLNTLHTLRNSGQITPDQFTKLRGMYKHYIPLRGQDGVEGEQRIGTGRGVDMRGKPVQRALGRKTKPANILGELVGDAERAQVQAAKAEVGRTLLRAAIEHPNPDYWQVERVTTEQKFSEATGEVYTAVVNDLTDEETIIVKHRGQPYRVRLVDPDLRKAMFNLGVEGFEGVAKWLGWVNRWLSAVFTRYNPAFVPVNLMRDIIQGSIGVASELGAKALGEVATLYPKAAAGLYSEARGLGDASVPDAQKTMADWAREFLQAGAATGYQTFADPRSLQQQIELEMAGLLDIAKSGKPLAAVSEAVRRSKTMHTIEVANEIVENSMRLSVYVQRRKSGVSQQAAAEYAKNLTVNFNRKGAGSAVGNALFLFFNASMQGSHRTLRLMKDPRVLAGLVGAGTAQFMMAMTMGAARYQDDEETLWEQIPDHVRQKAFVIPLGFDDQGGPQYVAIPMPFGFNLFTYAGGYPALLASDTWRSRHNPVKKTMGDIARAGVDAFSVVPVGENGWYFPTVVRIFSNLQANKDDLGRDIRQEESFGKFERPRSVQGKADTPGLYKEIATLLNRIGGGDDYTKPVSNLLDVAPEDIEYLMGTFTGGPGTMIQQMWRSGERAGAGLPTRLDDIPVARRVVGSQAKPQVDSAIYYDTAEVMERGLERLRDRFAEGGEIEFYALRDTLGPEFAGVELKRYKGSSDNHRRGDVQASADRSPELAALDGSVYKAYKDAGKAVKGYGAEIRRTHGDESMDRLERRRQIERLQFERQAAMRGFIDSWNATE